MEKEINIGIPTIRINEADSLGLMLPPQTVPAKTRNSVGKQGKLSIEGNAGLLGSDLVIPVHSEFKLKRSMDPKDGGRSTMEWINDQRAQGGRNSNVPSDSMPQITLEMIQQHNSVDDAWMALRGQVFDVTSYIAYHPGGAKEIMKGVGKDGTALFNSIHRYVNFEKILKGKKVGVYAPNKRRDSISVTTGAHLVAAAASNIPKRGDSVRGRSNMCCCCFKANILENRGSVLPATNFSEDSNFCFYTVDLKNKNFGQDCWNIAILTKNTLLLKVVTIPPEMWVAQFKLRDSLKNDAVNAAFTHQFRTMTLKLEKPKALTWKDIGESLPESNVILDGRHVPEDRNPCRLVAREELANNIYLMVIEVAASARIGVPVAFDVKISRIGEDVSRRYTPVPLLFNKGKYEYKSECEIIYFIIKVYPNGKMTQFLKYLELNKGSQMEIGWSCGTFNTNWLRGADIFFLFAAGSGLTPFIGIIQYFLENIKPGTANVVLVHWSKLQIDLVWKDEFQNLSKKNKWFTFLPVLTQVVASDTSWTGLRGRLSIDLLKNIIALVPASKTKINQVRFMSCGPEGFNPTVCDIIQKAGYPLTSTFMFLG